MRIPVPVSGPMPQLTGLYRERSDQFFRFPANSNADGYAAICGITVSIRDDHDTLVAAGDKGTRMLREIVRQTAMSRAHASR